MSTYTATLQNEVSSLHQWIVLIAAFRICLILVLFMLNLIQILKDSHTLNQCTPKSWPVLHKSEHPHVKQVEQFIILYNYWRKL